MIANYRRFVIIIGYVSQCDFFLNNLNRIIVGEEVWNIFECEQPQDL